jgi:hypothetical protein
MPNLPLAFLEASAALVDSDQPALLFGEHRKNNAA